MLSLDSPERPLVALSGGADSCALLLLLCEAADAGLLPQPAGAAHLHHGMRGADADADAAFCAALASRYGLPCFIELAALGGANEAEARDARYAFLQDAATALGAGAIATGHHADDQAETVLLRLFRGTSVTGLGGIPARRDNIIRPLLFARRSELEAYCTQHGITPRHDPTNDDPRYPRRRIRTLLPELTESFNPRLTDALCRLADYAREDSTYLDALAASAQDSEDLRPLPRPLRRRIILQRLWQASKSNAALREELATSAWVERLEQLLQVGGQLNLPHGLEAQAYQGNLSIVPCRQDTPLLDWHTELPVPGDVVLPDSRMLTATIGPCLTHAQRHRRSLSVDCGTIPATLTVRSVREGDRIAPLGMRGKTRLVRDLLREAGVPAATRSLQLVVESEKEILWLVGVAQAEVTRVPVAMKQVLLLKVRDEEKVSQ